MNFLHYMPVPSELYNGMIINMILDNDCFESSEHTFIIKDFKCYKKFEGLQNVCFLEKKNFLFLNRLMEQYDYIFIHGFDLSFFQQLFLSAKLLKKMIWCVWGHDLYKWRNNSLKKINVLSLLKFCKIQSLYVINRYKIRNIKCICIGFPYDEIEIKKVYGSGIPVKRVSYGLGYDFQYVQKSSISSKNVNKQNLHVMIGHSSFEFLNHEKILKNLEKYSNEHMDITIPVSYGNMKYKNELIEKCKKYSLSIKFLEEYMDAQEYLEYLSSVDIAVFDFTHQAAVATIHLLLFMGKKIYVNKDGIIYKGFVRKNVSLFDCKDIGAVEFEKFIDMNYDKESGKICAEKAMNPKIIMSQWHEIISECKKNL